LPRRRPPANNRPKSSEAVEETPEEASEDKLPGFQWKSALLQSAFFLTLQHAFRFTESRTRAELKGPFFREYFESVRSIHGWDDGNKYFTNYVSHPAMGSTAGFIQIQNDPRYRAVEFGQPGYWRSRGKATAWAAGYSVMFEIGLASEASLGNVGTKLGRAGWVDLVVTPLGGFGLMALEDSLDRYVVKRIERSGNRWYRGISRSLLTPTRGLASMLRLRPPWCRPPPREPGTACPKR
jgi:hypothetical protein